MSKPQLAVLAVFFVVATLLKVAVTPREPVAAPAELGQWGTVVRWTGWASCTVRLDDGYVCELDNERAPVGWRVRVLYRDIVESHPEEELAK